MDMCMKKILSLLLVLVLSLSLLPAASLAADTSWSKLYAEYLSTDPDAVSYAVDTFSRNPQPDLLIRRGSDQDTSLEILNIRNEKVVSLCTIPVGTASIASVGQRYIGLLLVSSDGGAEQATYFMLENGSDGRLVSEQQYVRAHASSPAPFTWMQEYAPDDLSGLDAPLYTSDENVYLAQQAPLLDESLGFSAPGTFRDFTVTDSRGEKISVGSLLETYEAVLINFFFIDCPWCQVEFPYLKTAAEQYADRVAVLCLSPFDKADAIEAHRVETGLPFLMAPDPDGRLAERYQVTGYPTSVLVRRDGSVSETFNTVLIPGLFEAHMEQALAQAAE